MPTKTDAKKTQRAPASVNPIKLLKDDHKEVHGLFQKYMKLSEKGADADERQPLAEQICMLLTIHSAAEEEIFYPAARAAQVNATLLDEAEVEHASCKELIDQILAMAADDALYDAKVKVLSEYIAHHVKEEEGELFPECAKSTMDLPAIGAQITKRKAELQVETAGHLEV